MARYPWDSIAPDPAPKIQWIALLNNARVRRSVTGDW
jgi:hypothetical protein